MRREFAEELRHWFALVGMSVRSYARKQGLTASSVTRYLNGLNLPSDDFVSDLVHEVHRQYDHANTPNTRRLRRLHQDAQDAQPGSWGHTKRLRRQISEARAEAHDAQCQRDLVKGELAQARWSLLRAGQALDSARPSSATSDAGDIRSWAQLIEQLQRTQAELSETKLLLTQARAQIIDLQQERMPFDEPPTDQRNSLTGLGPVRWYPPETLAHLSCWDSYRKLLLDRGRPPRRIAQLDELATAVVRQLSDPQADRAVHRRGIVLGYPQAGITSDAIGIIAKAIDIGYRLIIVLSGPLEMLRRQLQVRLDEDLPAMPGIGAIIRLTDEEWDYGRLAGRLDGLQFERAVPEAPFNEGRNLARAPTRVVVMKKNLFVMRRLVSDLRTVRTPLEEVPALVIDTGTDEDSVGTSVAFAGHNALGTALGNLMEILPRAQYIGLTTRPLSSTVPNQDGTAAPFRADFVTSIPRPDGYFGLREVHQPAPRSNDLG
ncbi:hypothetical protein [Polymorphospora rubra]|uniref:hypothetical protein n=1 Tax=Polymorphospora rubra TaxID=338584 RepID=UPI0031E16DEE